MAGSIRPPGSKSLTNRALICAALADGPCHLRGGLISEDTRVMIDSLAKVGVEVQTDGPSWCVRGRAKADRDAAIDLHVANSGTSIRFLTAMLSAIGGDYRLSGVPRMHARPIGDLIEALQPVHRGQIEAISVGGCPPVRMTGGTWRDLPIAIGGGVSSQYLSGLLMAAPATGRRVKINIDGDLVSRPYVEMTTAVMRSFGADVRPTQAGYVVGGQYKRTDYEIEPDASAASYFWCAAAITGGRVRVDGLTPGAMQGDVGLVNVLAQMGCQVCSDERSITVAGGPLRGVDVDMNEISDTVQSLAMVALFADGPTRVRGVEHNRFKETDRIGDLATELRKLGATVEEHRDGLTINPLDHSARMRTVPVRLATYEDHRMAMSFSLAGLRLPGVEIENPACTGKTYPNYWADLQRLIGRPHRWAA